MSSFMAWWGRIPTPLVIAFVVLLMLLAVVAVKWLLTHDMQEKLTNNLLPYYKADRTSDDHRLSEREREILVSSCIRVWRTPHGYVTHVTRRLAHGLNDQVLIDAAKAACPKGWRHHVRKICLARWIISDGRKD